MKRLRLPLAAAVVGALCLVVVPAAAARPTPPGGNTLHASVVVRGLNNPKHLAFGRDGHLYVTESGLGDPTQTSCVTGIGAAGPPPTQLCVGKTGAVARIDGNHATTVLGGLESEQELDTGETIGPAAVTWIHGQLAVVMQDFDVRQDGSNGLIGGDQLGKIVQAAPFSPRYSWTLTPDVAAFAAAHPQSNPGGAPGETAWDSDPYAITPYRGGWAIADAAANSLLWLSPTNQLTLLARFPTFPETAPAGVLGPDPVPVDAQAVPTSVAVGPDGALYVGGLRGVPSLPGTADVYRVQPGHAPTVWATGFSAITDLAFDHQGRLLVLEFATGGLLGGGPGALIRVNRNHSRTTINVPGGLASPTGLAVGHDGSVYISNNGESPGTATPSGEVVKLTGGLITH